MKRYNDFLGGVVIFFVCMAFFIETFSIHGSVSKLGAAFFPRLIVGILALMGIILAVQGFRSAHKEKAEPVQQGEKEGTRRLLLSVIAVFLYVVLLYFIGFTVSTALYLTAQFIILDEKHVWTKWKSALAGVIVAVGVYLVFTYLFQVELPTGMLSF
jgi:predicted anti-sigma-YlaC factor YlaD